MGAKLVAPEHVGAVVAWIQAGVTAYQRLIATGAPMPIPASVKAATAEYFDEEDTLGAWASDCLEEGAEMSATILYAVSLRRVSG